MSYCRFENTSRDLEDCIEAIENGEINELNEYEIEAIKTMQYQAKCILEMKDDIEIGIKDSEEYNQEEEYTNNVPDYQEEKEYCKTLKNLCREVRLSFPNPV